jgi:hypothetical protein
MEMGQGVAHRCMIGWVAVEIARHLVAARAAAAAVVSSNSHRRHGMMWLG